MEFIPFEDFVYELDNAKTASDICDAWNGFMDESRKNEMNPLCDLKEHEDRYANMVMAKCQSVSLWKQRVIEDRPNIEAFWGVFDTYAIVTVKGGCIKAIDYENLLKD